MLFTSGGSPNRIAQGKNAILAAVIGLSIVFGSWFIYKAVFNAITGQSMFSVAPAAMARACDPKIQSCLPTGVGSNPTTGNGNSLLITPPPGIPTDVTQLISNITTWLLSIVGGIAALMILYGAFQILIAGGSPERYESGKKTIFYAIIGLVVVILSSALVELIRQLLGAK